MKIDQSMELIRKILMAVVAVVTLLAEDVYTRQDLETDAMTWMKLVWYFNRARQESRRKSELTRHNWTQHRAAIEAGQVVTPVRPFWLDLLDAEGQVVYRGGMTAAALARASGLSYKHGVRRGEPTRGVVG
jgi:hypothetical protein